MEKDYNLEYQCLLSGIYIEAIKQLLLDKKIITEKEWSDKIKYILSEPNLKDIYDRIEYFMHLQKISEKEDDITEEEEKYLLEKGVKYYSEDELKTLIEVIKQNKEINRQMNDAFDNEEEGL